MQAFITTDVTYCEPIQISVPDDSTHKKFVAGPKQRVIAIAVDDEGANYIYEAVRKLNG